MKLELTGYCGRWLHEDCAEDRELDEDGQERFVHTAL